MLTIGTRGSPLALAQTKWVEGRILSRFPDIRTVLKIIKTSADKDTRTSIRSGSATGVVFQNVTFSSMTCRSQSRLSAALCSDAWK